MCRWWGERPVTKAVGRISKINPGSHGVAGVLTLCKAYAPYLPPSVPGPACTSTHKSHFPVRMSIKLEFSWAGHAISNPLRLHASSSYEPLWLLRWPLNLGFYLVWKTVFKWLSIGKMLACVLPHLWLKCSVRGHLCIPCWRNEHICIWLWWLALPTVSAPLWSWLRSFLSSRCLIDWGQEPGGCLPWSLLFGKKVRIGGNDT